jgi:hypothetical protein
LNSSLTAKQKLCHLKDHNDYRWLITIEKITNIDVRLFF